MIRLGSGDPVFVTGGTGFVGAAVIRRLVARGARVSALARDPRALRVEGVERVVAGDLRDAAALEAGLAGVRACFHVVADYRLWVPDPETMHEINVAGTERLMRAALAAGVERIVHTSSVATLGLHADGTPADESRPLDAAAAIGVYKQTKVLAERVVERLVAEEGLPAVIVNPSTPVGPCDVKPTPTGRMIVEAATGRIPAYVDTGLNIVHVDDVAEGHLLALEKGETGRRYILGGENMTLGAMLARIAVLVGRRPPAFALPRLPLYPLAAIAELHARLTGHVPMLTRDALRMAKARMFFSSSRAERELGYAARPADIALADAIAWFRSEGKLA